MLEVRHLEDLVKNIRDAFEQRDQQHHQTYERINDFIHRLTDQAKFQMKEILDQQEIISKQQKEIKDLQDTVTDMLLTGTNSINKGGNDG
jgi:hypothetical protein